jgi:hypothetical protein
VAPACSSHLIERRIVVSEHAVNYADVTAAIRADADFYTQEILGVHFWETYSIREPDEALEAADGVLNALDHAQLVVVDAEGLDQLRAVYGLAQTIIRLRKTGVGARDTRWKIAWRELEENTQ